MEILMKLEFNFFRLGLITRITASSNIISDVHATSCKRENSQGHTVRASFVLIFRTPSQRDVVLTAFI